MGGCQRCGPCRGAAESPHQVNGPDGQPSAVQSWAHHSRTARMFRLVVVHGMVAAVLASDGRTVSVETLGVSRPLMLTSSSLGDDLVEGPRRSLFERLVVKNDGTWLRAQARFHTHQWPSRPHVSVRMERPDARTVSRTQIDVTSQGSELCYDPLGSDEATVMRMAPQGVTSTG